VLTEQRAGCLHSRYGLLEKRKYIAVIRIPDRPVRSVIEIPILLIKRPSFNHYVPQVPKIYAQTIPTTYPTAVDVNQLIIRSRPNPSYICCYLRWTRVDFALILSLLMSYIHGIPCKSRNFNVVYIWTYVWQRWKPSLSICCTVSYHWMNVESFLMSQLCVNTLPATKITLITDGIYFGRLRVKRLSGKVGLVRAGHPLSVESKWHSKRIRQSGLSNTG
jgi:hypothetical protein